MQQLAILICAAVVAGLFYLDRDKTAVNSKGLWLPVIWLWIIGSRPVSMWLTTWFGIGQSGASNLEAQLDGSPMDAFFFMGLLATAIIVLLQRPRRLEAALKSAPWVFYLYLVYCLVSCIWSPFPDVAFKRWTKAVGDLAMVLVIVTDPEPLVALRRVFTRVGFVLFPANVLTIRFTTLGYTYDPGGAPMFSGVTTNKNTLGLIVFVIMIGAVWSLINLLQTERSAKRSRQVLARLSMVILGSVILYKANSATSIACFLIGASLILVTHTSFFKRHPQRVPGLVLTIIVVGSLAFFFGGKSVVAGALGREGDTLGDRTLIWAAAIPVNPSALLGAGFESFWNGYGRFVVGDLSIYEQGMNSAHNGYIEIWLNLGWVGVVLIAGLLVSGFGQANAAFRRSPEVGALMLAFVASVSMYSVTEAGYRIMTPTAIMFFLVLVGARTIAASAGGGKPKSVERPIEARSKEWAYAGALERAADRESFV